MPSALPAASSNLLDALNHSLFLSINASPGTAEWALYLARLIATVPLYLLPLGLLWLWCRNPGWRGDVLRALAVMATGLALAQLIGLLWPTPRPFAMGLGHAWIHHVANASFPSDHMTLFACAALSLLSDKLYRPGAVIALSGILVGLSRVYLGIHFPLDLLGGCAIAAVANSLVWLGWNRWGWLCTTQVETLYRRWMGPLIRRGWISA